MKNIVINANVMNFEPTSRCFRCVVQLQLVDDCLLEHFSSCKFTIALANGSNWYGAASLLFPASLDSPLSLKYEELSELSSELLLSCISAILRGISMTSQTGIFRDLRSVISGNISVSFRKGMIKPVIYGS